MKVLLDTTALVALVAAKSEADEIESMTEGHESFTTALNQWEVSQGISRKRDAAARAHAFASLDEVLRSVEPIPVADGDVREAAALLERMARKSRDPGDDVLVAVTGVRGGVEAVVTKNTKHFKWLSEELAFEVWTHS